MKLMMVAVMLSLAVGGGGCVSGIRPVPDYWGGTSDPDCTESKRAVMGDAAISAGLAGVSLGAVGARYATSHKDAADAVEVTSLLVGMGFAAAAAIGDQRVETCRAARARWAASSVTVR